MSATKVLRSLFHELRVASPNGVLKNSLAARYILTEFRKNEWTDEQYCKKNNDALYTAETYLSYLSSLRRYNELYKEFHGRGERTVKETADLVGFKLPDDPK